MSETNWNTLIISLSTLLTTVVTGIVAVLVAKMNRKTDEAKEVAKETATKVEEVKVDLVNVGAKTDRKLNEIHSLVNSKFTTLITSNAIALRRVADTSGNTADEAAAVYAETALAEHLKELENQESESLKVEIVKIPNQEEKKEEIL